MLDELDFGHTEPIVRVNSVGSGLAEDDINTVMQAKSLPPTWMLPKVDDPMDIQWVRFCNLSFYAVVCIDFRFFCFTCNLFIYVSECVLFDIQ